MREAIAAGGCLALLALGCSDGPSPADQCDMLVDRICDRFGECAAGRMLPEDWRTDCEAMLARRFPCAMAKAVDETYAGCLDQLGTSSCTQLFGPDLDQVSLPRVCGGAVLFER